MRISDFILDNIFRPRLKQGCLVIYDPALRYRELVNTLISDNIRVVDATKSSIEARSQAISSLQQLTNSQNQLNAFVIYVPASKPIDDDGKQIDPFSIYSTCGAVFPENDGDEYINLCLRARPDYATEIRKVFQNNADPPFAVIDAIGGGIDWPNLRALLKADSARDILMALLSPTKEQQATLELNNTWVSETRDFLRSTLGLNPKTRSKAWSTFNNEIWRFLLFSEFVFDLSAAIPAALSIVPRASTEAEPLVRDLCERLRSDLRTQSKYIEKAEQVEQELSLPDICKDIEYLGKIDTFPFEERFFLKHSIAALMSGDIDTAKQISSSRMQSVWLGKGESQAQWGCIQATLALVEACDDYDRQLGDYSRSLNDLLDFYAASLREVDRLQREFEQTLTSAFDADGLLFEAIQYGRNRYARLIEKVQTLFIRHLETMGWPPQGRLSNSDVFDRFVAPRLIERGHRVAYLLIDALRYELGVALQKLLADDGPVELHAAYAEFPTITLVGMASLLPEARKELSLDWNREKQTLVPKLSGAPVSNVAQRMDCLRKRLGDRFMEMRIHDFLRKKKIGIPETVDLLVLRSVEIDEHLENSPETTLALIPDTLNVIRASLHRLRTLGFTDAVIATDHGFFLNAQAEAGDVCTKPQGTWLFNTSRSMLGTGNADLSNLVMSTEKLAIRGDFANFSTPRSMAPYRNGLLYFHGGASIAEALVPVLIAKLDSKPAAADLRKIRIELSYKGGATKITTRIPVVDVSLLADNIFSLQGDFEILLEAQDSKGNVVGEPKPGGPVNPATRTIILSPNQRLSIALRMQLEFEGGFTIRALNPKTLTAYASLNLETDYTV